jgi:hypothetical protein
MNFKLLCFSISIFILVRCISNENGSSKHSAQNRISSSTNNINNSQKPYHDSLVFHLGNDKSWYSLKFVVDPSKVNSLRIIKFYKEGTLIQTIHANKNIENDQFDLVDWNFDGYKDITAIDNSGSGGTTYLIWNYSPLAKKYVYNNLLSGHSGLEIDTTSKFIVFHYRAGYNEESWDTSKYVKNKLVFVNGLFQERWNDQKGNSWIKNKREKMVHGIRKRTVDSTIVK